MNFGLQLASGRVAGVRFDLPALNGHREPESLDDALATYLPILMPERDPAGAIHRLEPVIHDPELARKIEEAAPSDGTTGETLFDDWDLGFGGGPEGRGRYRSRWDAPPVEVDDSPLAHVVGVILGSPEFQRR